MAPLCSFSARIFSSTVPVFILEQNEQSLPRGGIETLGVESAELLHLEQARVAAHLTELEQRIEQHDLAPRQTLPL